MKVNGLGFVLAAGFLVLVWQGDLQHCIAATAKSLTSEVTSVDGSVTITRGTSKLKAMKGAAISAGDRLLIEPGSSLCIRTNKKTCLTATSSPYIIPPSAPVSAAKRPNLAFIFFGKPNFEARFETKGRRTGTGAQEPLGDASLIPSGPADDTRIQYMPAGYRSLPLLYTGELPTAGWQVVTDAGRRLDGTFDPDTRQLTFPESVTEPVTLSATINGQSSTFWTIKPDENIPSPVGMTQRPLNDEDRLERAVWLIRFNSSWRIFALAELADLSARDVPNAREALEIARSDGCVRKRGDSCPYLSR